ncbi:MAG: hypothetical protein E5V41_05870 [Mesorhizobium sp.]|nr:MAG: hypothetical protein E5V41_05870 [Mesorhizobium sp.]
MSASVPVATIKKNSREEISISLDFFNGHRVFNARVFYEAEDGSRRPGRAGIAFTVDKLEAFAEGVTSALMAAKSKGFVK